MKKTVAIILIMLTAISCSLMFVACKNNDEEDIGDEFVGAISQNAYDSVEDTAKGFLLEELFGSFVSNIIDEIYQGYTKTFDLLEEKIHQLSIVEELQDGIVSAEKGIIEYFAPNFNEYPAYFTSPTERIVYIIVYEFNGETKYRYYVLADEVGETLTASALSSLLNAEKYANSTFKYVTKYGVAIGIQKYAHNSVYYREVKDPYLVDASTNEEYVIIYNDTIYRVSGSLGGNWTVYEQDDLSPNASSMRDDIFLNQLGLVIMYNRFLFTKTETGYQSSEYSSEFGGLSNYSNVSIKIFNGRITEISTGDDYEFKMVISDFGMTEIDVPQYIIDAIETYITEN